MRDAWPEDWPLPAVIENTAAFPLEIRVDEPRRVGIDRLLNAVAANAIRPAGRGAVIVDTGTATTVDLVSAEGAFEGGAILPGFELSAKALHHYTALLPLVSIEELAREPHEPLGRNTQAALRSGLFWGQLGAVRELVARLSAVGQAFQPDIAAGEGESLSGKESGKGDRHPYSLDRARPESEDAGASPLFRTDSHDAHSQAGKPDLQEPPCLLLTGGGAGLLAGYLPEARHEPHLALQGIALVAAAGRRGAGL